MSFASDLRVRGCVGGWESDTSALWFDSLFTKDQWQTVEKHSEYGIEFMEKLNDFMKRQAEIEFQYAKDMQKTIKTFREDFNKKNNDKNNPFQKAILSW